MLSIGERNKIIFVADSVHGSIQISSLEKSILSTQAFNRLHSINQNSTVYLTYPSNRTKRFEHSLGTMHLTGLIFYYSIVNADENTRNSFFDNIKIEVEQTFKDNKFTEMLRFAMESEEDYTDLIDVPQDRFYETVIPRAISNDQRPYYLLIYQSLRCVALLHDIGHPPFSHITETAIEKAWDVISCIPESERNDLQNLFLKQTEEFFDETDSSEKLHEKIGKRISDRILENIIRKEVSTPTEIMFYCFVRRMVDNILNEKDSACGNSTLYKDLHRIIDGSIDSDRLDYISRDLNNSGYNDGQIEYDRIIPTFKLIENNEFLFCPDTRTLSTIEDMFNRRWKLYKYIICHHRVIKTDYLLGNIIKELILDYLRYNCKEELENDSADDGDTDNTHALQLNISGTWKAIKEGVFDKKYFNGLIQWDDSWLISVLRYRYFEYYKDDGSIISMQLEELLSNKKLYNSLIKRMDDFLEVDQSFIDNVNIDLGKLKLIVPEKSVRPKIIKLEKDIKSYREEEDKKIITEEGFFLRRIKLLYDTVIEWEARESIIDEKQTIEKAIKKAVSIVAERFEVIDHMVVFKEIDTGLNKLPYLRSEDNVVLLNEVSRIAKELKNNRMVFPLFFIYYYSGKKIEDLHSFRKAIGAQVGDEVSKAINSLIDEIIEK